MIGPRFSTILASILLFLTTAPAQCALLYESATTLVEGPVGSMTTGVATNSTFYSGAKLLLSHNATTTAIGGHFQQPTGVEGNDQIFAAIVSLPDMNAVPDLDNDVVASVLIPVTITPAESANISAPIFTSLGPGWYAIVFGSGRFGATAENVIAIRTNEDGPVNAGIDNTFTIRTSDGVEFAQGPGIRYFLEGNESIPEPGSCTLIAMAVCGYAVARRRRTT